MIISTIKRFFGSFLFTFITLGMLTYLYWPLGTLTFLGFWLIGGGFISALLGIMVGTLWTIIIYPGLKIGIMIPLVILRILIYLFISTPLHFIGQSSSFIWNGFEASVGNLVKKKTKDTDNGTEEVTRPKIQYVLVFLFFALGLIYVVGVDVSTFTAMMQDATIITVPLIFLPLVFTIFVSGIALKLQGVSFSSEAPSTQDRIDRIDQASNVAENAAGIYSDLDHINEKKEAIKDEGKALKNSRHARRAKQVGKAADKAVESRGLMRIGSKLRAIPKIGPWLSDILAGTAGGSAIAVLLVILITLLIVWGIVALILWGGVYALFRFIFAPFLGEAFGVATGFGADVGGAVSSGPSASLDAPSGVSNSIDLATARISCMLQGPACMQEWRANNTQRPGSEDVGREFGLEIERFNVDTGGELDISRLRQSDTIPVQFDVYNPIQGLKGIEARDVQYRVAIDGGPTTNCVTDWKDLGGRFLGSDNNAISPGGFASPTSDLEDLTLKNCGALQPGYSQDMNAELQIKYDYSSQSTLQFQAMAEDYRLEQDLVPAEKESQTANTPVKAFVNAESPVAFRDTPGGRQPTTFPVWFGFETDSFNLEYKVKPEDFKIYISSLLTDVDRVSPEAYDLDTGRDEFSGTCDGISYQGENEYNLSSEYERKNIQSYQGEESWFSKGDGPSDARCTMILAPETLNSISPTGETMNIRVDANYTVTLSSNNAGFEVTNERCGSDQINCPMIVPESDNEGGNISSTCDTGTDIQSTDGCTVVENTDAWASDPEIINNDSELSTDISNRETAYRLSTLIDDINQENPPGKSDFSTYDKGYNKELIAGIEDLPSERTGGDGGWIVYRNSDREVEVSEVETSFCEEHSSKDEIITYLAEENRIDSRDDVIYATYIKDEKSILEKLTDTLPGNQSCPLQDN